MLHKNLANSVKDVDTKSGVVCGYASSFNVVDDGNDMVLPGAFTKTLAQQGPASKQPRIKFLYQHDSTQILGVPQVLKEDGFGLYFEAKIAPTTLGNDVLTLYAEGIITEHSIGYETVEADWDRSKAVRLLRELKLYEFSSVTWGMNPETPTVGVKGLTDPSHITTLATKAAAIQTILHSGNLRSAVLCETLERELKALALALAPADAVSQPYSIQGVLDSMNDLTSRLGRKAATQAEKDAQAARSKKYGIGIKDGGNVTKPSAWKDVPDAEWGDPVNYRYPMPDKAHADDAASRFGAETARSEYTKAEQDIIDKRIAARQKDFGESDTDDSGKGANMGKRLIKGTGGDLEVSSDGTHAAYTGTHTHAHKAMGSQGGDDTHSHSHTHDGDASHNHPDDHGKASQHQHIRKARDFGTLFASLNESDQLQDDWGDTFIAFVQCMEELMWQATAQANGWTPEGSDDVDIADAAQSNIDAFSSAVLDLVNRSVAADFVPCLTPDRDQFIDPDGPNAESDDDDWKQRRNPLAPKAMPDAPALLGKAGRAISSANRAVITDALDGMSKAMGDLQMHHKSIADLMTKTDPDAVRQDEDDVEGDDDTENGGTNPNKSRGRQPYTPRRTAAVYPTRAGTTHQGHGLDLSALDADLNALKSRRR